MERRLFLRALLGGGALAVSSPALSAAGLLSAIKQPSLVQPPAIPSGQFMTLCLHDVRNDVRPGRDRDPYAISTARLITLFDWMRTNDWRPISLQQVLDAVAGNAALPGNAVLLTWDDGLESIYSQVFPLLKAYAYPALFALQTGWLSRYAKGESVDYESQRETGTSTEAPAPHSDAKAAFVTWAQLREMRASGLVEFASHTHNLHNGIPGNPQGNSQPAAITRQYFADAARYETDSEFQARIRDDLNTSAQIIERETGARPRAIAWPYGAMNEEVEAIAVAVGMTVSLGLGDHHLDRLTQSPSTYGRVLLVDSPTPAAIEAQVIKSTAYKPPVERAVQVDLDYIHDPDPAQTEANMGKLLDRIKALRISTVYLQAFADHKGTGTPRETYFPNSVLPMRADLFNRVAWQLRTRCDVRVYAWLPMLAFELPDPAQQARLAVKTRDADGKPVAVVADYQRLSPFLPETLQLVGQIYADLGKQASGIHGLLIHDDAYLAEAEDASVSDPAARWPGTTRSLNGGPLSPRDKTRALIDFGAQVSARLRYYVNASNHYEVARNLYARVVLDPAAEARFAQALEPFLAHYDRVALMAMPYLDGTEEPARDWLKKLAERVAQTPGGLKKVVFELQARDWKKNQWIAGETLKNWMQLLISLGGVNLAYYPDDFLNDHPPFKLTYEAMSLNAFPYYPVNPR
jgi:biofilm PGA synthesis lipoprotein PgaB